MTYNVFGGTISLTQSISQPCTVWQSKGRVKTKKMADVMHCNLRPPDIAPLVHSCNYEAHIKREVGSTHRVHNILTADTLQYNVTFVLNSLTLNVFPVWVWGVCCVPE